MTTKARVRPQIHMDDKVIEDAELSQLLEDREEAKKAASEYKAVDKKTKAKIMSMEQQPPYRIGRFIITKRQVEGRHVEFDTDSVPRIDIKLAGD